MKRPTTVRKQIRNELACSFPAISENESLARAIAAHFLSGASPTVSQLADMKCAVSEAVTNCIVHAYPNGGGNVRMILRQYSDNSVTVTISDSGIGIPDITAAKEPLYTTDTTGERSGMGFAIMESLTDKMTVHSVPNKGTTVILKMRLGRDNENH